MDRQETLRRAREILSRVTPLRTDCGRTCGHLCCQPDEDGKGGMLLFPGEEALYSPLPDGFAITKQGAEIPGALLLTCSGHCERDQRPLSCRLFPLLPRERDGVVRAVRDRRGYVVCPLLPGGLSGFAPEFREAVVRAGELLYAQDEHRAFLTALHGWIRTFDRIWEEI